MAPQNEPGAYFLVGFGVVAILMLPVLGLLVVFGVRPPSLGRLIVLSAMR